MRRLIIGSNGNISKYFCQSLKLEQFDFRTLNRSKKNLTDIGHSLCDASLVELVDDQFDILYVFASTLIPNSSLIDFQREVQELFKPLISMVEKFKKPKKIVYISSGGCVYRKGNRLNKETDETFSHNHYGRFKIKMEKALIELSEQKDFLSYNIIRPSNIYGTYSGKLNNQGIINNIIHSIQKNQKLSLWNNGDSIRDYIHIDDFTRSIIRLEKVGNSNVIYNLGTGIGTSSNQIINMFNERLNYPVKTELKFSENYPGNDINILDIDRIANTIDYKSRSISVGISQVIDEYINI